MSTRTSKKRGKAHQNLSDWETRLLWVAAGGRCEICRKLLTESGMTHHELNLAERAHIIGQGGKKSPRFDTQLSPALATSKDNIMLLCFDCHAEIDDAETRHKWPVETLKSRKELHEERIKYLTSLDAKKTRVMVFQTAIQQSREGEALIQQHTTLHKGDLHDAVLPEYFPDKPEPSRIRVDLPTEESPDHWEQLRKTVRAKWDKSDTDDAEHLSVFCLGKVPAVMYFGRLVGDTRQVRIMNVQKGVPTRWKTRDQMPGNFEYKLSRPEKAEWKKKDILLIVSLTGVVEAHQYSTVMPSDVATYRIDNQTENLHPNWLVAEEQVKEFRKIYQHLLSEIQERHGQESIIHILVAAPTPIVFEVGRQYRPNHNPVLKVYNCLGRRYEFAFSLGG